MVLAGKTISSAVLETRKRVLTQEAFLDAVGRARKAKGGTGSTLMVDGLPPFLAAENLKPFISDELRGATTPIRFRSLTGLSACGLPGCLLHLVQDALASPDDFDGCGCRNDSRRWRYWLRGWPRRCRWGRRRP